MAKIFIDNQPVEVDDRQSLLANLLSLGFNLDYFCWHPKMGSVGACRQCAVKQFRDDKDTRGKIVMACMTAAKDGTRISVDDPEVRAFRANIIGWLMENHPHDCPVCDEGGECHLQDMTVMTGHDYRSYRWNKRTFVNQYLGPFVNHEMNRCIQCYRCVRYYREIAGGRDFDAFALHNTVYFGRAEDGVLESEFSGNLVEVCPTGVFTDATLKHHYARKWDLQTAPSICINCAVGCNTVPGERYGVLRRVRARYNGEVNGYFLCDRGRYGYEFVNGERRIRSILILGRARGSETGLEQVAKPVDEFAADPGSGVASPDFSKPSLVPTETTVTLPEQALSREQVLQRLGALVAGRQVIGIGSPRASLEANFALRTLVGPERFYSGVPEREARLIRLIVDILRHGNARSPSLSDVEQSDAVLILGEDVINVAPMLAHALRQTVLNQPRRDVVDKARIPHWDDNAVRTAIGARKGPFFVVTPNTTKLDEIATGVHHAAPEDIARIGFAVARALGGDVPPVTGLSDEANNLVQAIAAALKGAQRPLVVAGPSLASEAIIQAAANVAYALHAQLSFTLPEANSLGLALLGAPSLDAAMSANAEAIVVLENDLYRRAGAAQLDGFLDAGKDIVVLDSLVNRTTARAQVVLPAATFAEADGTLVNNEGRAQRFYQVFVPQGEIQESWRWLRDIGAAAGRAEMARWSNLDDVIYALADAFPVLKPIREIAPPAGFRVAGMKIPRQTPRVTGRTAVFAHLDVHEPKPPEDPDSPLTFSMEGYRGDVPPALIPEFWAPGWNSNQSVNKFQIEVGGPLRGGDPGRRLIEPEADGNVKYFTDVPAAFQRRDGHWRVVPLYHIFGSEEQSVLTPGIAELAPKPYVALNPDDAERLNVWEGQVLAVQGQPLPVKLAPALPPGLVGLMVLGDPVPEFVRL